MIGQVFKCIVIVMLVAVIIFAIAIMISFLQEEWHDD